MEASKLTDPVKKTEFTSRFNQSCSSFNSSHEGGRGGKSSYSGRRSPYMSTYKPSYSGYSGSKSSYSYKPRGNAKSRLSCGGN